MFWGVYHFLQPQVFQGLKMLLLIGLINNWSLESVIVKTKLTVKD